MYKDDWTEYIGKTVLLEIGFGNTFKEAKIIAVSPNKRLAKIQTYKDTFTSTTEWVNIYRHKIADVLY